MTRQQRRVGLAVGAVFLALFGWLVRISLVTGIEESASESTAATVVGGAAILIAGVTFLLSGLRERIAIGERTIEWWQLQSVGFASLGWYMAISALAVAPPQSLFDLASVAAGLGFVAFGVQRLRAGPPVESEPSVRQVATIVVGTVAIVAAIALAMIWST